MIIDFILEHVTLLKQMQSLGAKRVLEHVLILEYVAILRHFTDLKPDAFQGFTQFCNTQVFGIQYNSNNETIKI